MNDLNQCNFIGRLGKDPAIRYLASGTAVADFSIACSRSWKDKTTGDKKEETDWINCAAFGKLAEIIGEYLKKGSQVYINGRFKTDKVEKDGSVKYYTKINVQDMKMLGSREQSNQGQHEQRAPAQQAAPQANNMDFDDDIPFS